MILPEARAGTMGVAKTAHRRTPAAKVTSGSPGSHKHYPEHSARVAVRCEIHLLRVLTSCLCEI